MSLSHRLTEKMRLRYDDDFNWFLSNKFAKALRKVLIILIVAFCCAVYSEYTPVNSNSSLNIA